MIVAFFVAGLPPRMCVFAQYTPQSLTSMAALKGRDAVVAEALQGLVDPHGRPLLAMQVAVVARTRIGELNDHWAHDQDCDGAQTIRFTRVSP